MILASRGGVGGRTGPDAKWGLVGPCMVPKVYTVYAVPWVSACSLYVDFRASP